MTEAMQTPEGVLDLLMDAVCVVDEDGVFQYASAAFERIFGYAPEEIRGRRMIELVLPEDRERTLAIARRVMDGEPMSGFENRYLRKDGRVVHVMWSARWSPGDRVRVAVARDVSARKAAESRQQAAYAISEAAHAASDLSTLFRLVQHEVAQLLPAEDFAVILRTPGGQGLHVAYHAGVLGMPSLEPASDEGRRLAALVEGGLSILEGARDRPGPAPSIAGGAGLWAGEALRGGDGVIGALLLRSAATAFWEPSHRALMRFVAEQVATAVERRRIYDQLGRQAASDELTGLANRRVLARRLDVALAGPRADGSHAALLYLDLDGLKAINDALGHAAGDQVIQETARRLAAAVRGADTVARVGGDEFVVLLETIARREDATLVADKLREAIAQPMRVAGRELRITPSIGIAIHPEDGADAEALMSHADAAMYARKHAARG